LENTKLISLLKSFSQDELKEFQKFVDSPFYNNEKSVSKFYMMLKITAPDFETKKILRENLYKKIYPDKLYNDAVMRNIISRTLKLAEEYLTIRNFLMEKDYRALLKMKALSDRDQAYLFEKARKEAIKIIEDNPYRDEGYYYSKMIYEDGVRQFEKRIKSKVFIENDNLQKITDNGIYFITTGLLTLYAVMTNQKKYIIEKKYDFGFMNTILGYYESRPEFFENIPYASLYYNSIKLFLTEKDEYFKKVHEIVQNNYNELKEVDRKNAYVVLINHCSDRISKGELEYQKVKFSIYKEIIEKGAHYEGLNFISHVFYNRVAFTAINIGELEWSIDFIEKYKEELNEEHRDNCYYLSMAEYNLKNNDYNAALENLSKVQKADYLYKQEVYTISLKIYYSSGMDDSFFTEIENYRSFLKTNKMVSTRKKELCLSFINLIKGLHSIKYKKGYGQKYDTFTLRKKIIENKYIVDKFWLLEKLSELEDGEVLLTKKL
jgi:hypothetical protein